LKWEVHLAALDLIVLKTGDDLLKHCSRAIVNNPHSVSACLAVTLYLMDPISVLCFVGDSKQCQLCRSGAEYALLDKKRDAGRPYDPSPSMTICCDVRWPAYDLLRHDGFKVVARLAGSRASDCQ
jgi:hypothetical protein